MEEQNVDARWSRNMPSDAVSSVWLHDPNLPERVAALLEQADATQDVEVALEALRRCSALLSTRYEIPPHVRVRIVQALLSLALAPIFELTVQSEMMMVLHVCWSGQYRRALRQHGLRIDWRRVYARFEAEHAGRWREGPHVLPHRDSVGSEHMQALCRLIDGARRYFDVDATEEMLALWLPQLIAGQESFCISLGLLARFLPANVPDKCRLWVPSLVAHLGRNDKCDTTASALLHLLARAARHATDIDWSPHLPLLFNRFAQMLDIDVSNRSNPLPNDRQWPTHASALVPLSGGASGQMAKSMAKFIVATLAPTSPTQTLLEQLLHAVRTAYHPSNEDAWSLPLCVLLRWLSIYFAKRHGRRQRQRQSRDDADDEKEEGTVRFVKVVLDTALLALYSSLDAMVSAAETALKCLAYVSPRVVFASLLQEVFPALDAVTETHRTMSALRALGATAVPLLHRRLHPQGAEQLQPLLYATLPAIDPNDRNKSVVALSFFWAVFCNVPFEDASLATSSTTGPLIDPVDGNDDDNDGDDDEGARRATMDLGEWALTFTTRLLEFVVHLDTGDEHSGVGDNEHANGGGGRNGGSGGGDAELDSVLLQLLDRVSRSFFACLSASVHELCARPLITMVQRRLHLEARKPLGMLVSAASASRPQDFLPVAFEALDARLRSASSPSELQWCLCMMSASVKRAGPHVVPFVARIDAIVARTIGHSERRVRHSARKLVCNALRALTQTYPLEYAAFPASWWTTTTPRHWQWWGRFHELAADANELEVQWHTPTQPELDAALQLAASVLREPQALLTSDASPPSLKAVSRAVRTFIAVVKGCVVLLGDFDDGAECLRASFTACNTVSRRAFPQLSPATSVALPDVGIGAGSLRTRLARLVTAVLQRLSTCESASPLAWQSLTALAQSLLFECGVWSQTYAKLCGLNQFARKQHREFASGRRCVLRSLLVEQCELIFYCRAELCRMRLRLSPAALALFDAVQRLCLHDQPSVNSDATDTVLRVTTVFPELTTRLARFGLDALDGSKLRHSQLRGAVALLLDEGLALSTFTNWSLLRRWITVLARCGRHEDDRVQAMLHPLFLRHARCFQRMPLDAVERTALIADLLALADTSKESLQEQEQRLHWRYELVAATYLWLLVRDDAPASDAELRYFVRSLTCAFAPLRVVAFAATTVLLANARRPPPALQSRTLDGVEAVDAALQALRHTDIEQLHIDDAASWSRTLFVDDDDAGFYDDRVTVYSYAGDMSVAPESLSTLDTTLLDELDAIFVAKMSDFVRQLVDDHPSLQSPDGDDDAAAAGTSEDITSFAYIFSCWPRNRFPAYSKDLDVQHVYLVQVIVESLTRSGDVIRALLDELSALVARSSDVDAQVTAAELFAGVVRGVRHWPFAEQHALQAKLATLLASAADSCALDGLDAWADAVRLCADNSDPRRVIYLVTPLLHVTSTSWPALPASVQMRRLRLLGCFVIEFGWRGQALRRALLALVDAHGDALSTYQQVRDELATVLFLLHNLDVRHDRRGLQTRPRSLELVAFAERHLQRLAAPDAPQSLLNMSLYWMSVSFTHGDVCTFDAVFFALFSHITAASQHDDRELADLAKYVAEIGAWAQYSGAQLVRLLCEAEGVLAPPGSSWHARCGALSVLLLLIPRHAFLIADVDLRRVCELLARTLQDPQLETRQLAAAVLCGVVASCGRRVSLPLMLKEFAALAATPLRQRHVRKRRRVDAPTATAVDADGDGDAQTAVLRRHAGVLGLGALVQSEPYDCPEWLPATLQLVSSHVSDPAPIDFTVREVLSQFKRTHQDTWHLLVRHFTEDQLDALTAAYVAPSYFV